MHAIGRGVAFVMVWAFLALVAAPAFAQTNTIGFPSTTQCSTTAPPLNTGSNPALPGAWLNPNRYGTGWDIYFGSATQLTVYWLTYNGSGQPVWLGNLGASTQQTASNGAIEFWGPLYQATLGNAPVVVGQVSVAFLPGSDTAAAVRWLWSAQSSSTHDECIYDYFHGSSGQTVPGGSPQTSGTPIDESYTGTWFDSGQSGWGVDINVGTTSTATYEIENALIYDASGNAVWLQGSLLSPTMSSTAMTLTYTRSNYTGGFPTANCTNSSCVTAHTAGSQTRSFSSSQAGSSSIAASVAAAITGGAAINWPSSAGDTNPAPITKLAEGNQILVTPTNCVIPSGQTTCAVTVSWSSTSSAYQVYRRNLIDDVLSTTPISPSSSGTLSDPLPAGADVQYEMHNGTYNGRLIFTSSEVVVPAAEGNSTPVSATPSVATTPLTDPASDAVGATLAQFRVDESGNATYSIPIQITPGTAGVAPKMALNYNSRLPSGVMGPGWTIAGNSQITRCRQTREDGDFMSGITPLDGNPPPINFTSSDRFCLDGVRLMGLTGSPTGYGLNTSTYSPENDPSTLVTATVSNSAAGPDSFTVQRKDGTTSTYGYTAGLSGNNARSQATANGISVSVAWSVARIQDSSGNYIDFDYTNSPGSTLPFSAGAVETVLNAVNYTGHATSPVSTPYATIQFNYATVAATNARLGYQGGVAFIQSQQLTSVVVTDSSHASNATFRYYQLGYQTSLSGAGYQELNYVKECRDATAAVCFPPTTFAWSQANYTFDTGTTTQNAPGGTNFYQVVGYKVADLDGDGRQDLVWAVNDGKCGSASSLYAGFLDRDSNNQMTLLTTNSSGQAQSPTCAPINLSGNDRAWYLVDYNGDGLADLMIGGAPGTNWAIYPGLGRAFTSTAFNTGSNLLSSTAIMVPDDNPNLTAAVGILADLNGDGLPDFIYPVEESTPGAGGTFTMARLMVRQAGGGFAFSDAYSIDLTFKSVPQCYTAGTCDADFNIFFFDAGHHSAIASDVNGDGRADLTFIVDFPSNTNPNTVFNPALAQPNSISGGNATDGAGDAQYWYQFSVSSITPPNGSTLGKVSFFEYWDEKMYSADGGTLPTTVDKFYVADLNGDGLADIFYQDPTDASGQTYHALINTGNGYQAPITVTGITNGSLLQLADINGDGKLDIIYPVGNAGNGTNLTYSYVDVVPSSTTAWTFTAPISLGSSPHSTGQWISLFGDFDGDGATDFLSILSGVNTATANLFTTRIASASTCTVATNTPPCSRYHAHDVIVGFTNGIGAVTNVNYQPLTNNGIYQNLSVGGTAVTTYNWGYGSPVFNLLVPMYVVSLASSSAPISGSANALSSVYYRYEWARMQSGGRGFLGFKKLITYDPNDLSTGGFVETLSNYYQSYPFIGMPAVTSKSVHTGSFSVFGAPYDTCAFNGPESIAGCFGKPSWISSPSTVTSLGETAPACSGPGCTIPVTTACSTPTAVLVYTEPLNAFTPAAAPQPIFTYTQGTSDWSYDLSTIATTSQVSNYFCFDTSSPAAYGNVLQTMTWTQDGSGNTVAQKLLTNTYQDDTTHWYLGRLAHTQTQFMRPSLPTISRIADFVYDPATGILTQEEVEKGQDAGTTYVDLTTLYSLDQYGNRTAAYQCSATVPLSSCSSSTSTTQQQSLQMVHRYARTAYDSVGRYSKSSSLPFYAPTAANGLDEEVAVSVLLRDEFGNATQQTSINGTTQYAVTGAMGRPYFGKDTTGKSTMTTYRWCTAVSCPGDAKFRSQTLTAGAPETWTYFDVLGRPIIKVTESFDADAAAQSFSGVCSYYDAHNRPVMSTEPFFVPATELSDGSPSLTTTTPCSSTYAAYSTVMQYDVLGRVARITNPDSGIIVRTYSALVTTSSNPRNQVWISSETRNALGEIVSTSDATDSSYASSTGLAATRSYDASGNMLKLSVAGPNGAINTIMNYDVMGRKYRVTDPDAGTSTYVHNAAGDIISQNDANGQTVTSSYDEIGRRWQRTTSGGASNPTTDVWTFDATSGYCTTYHSCGLLVSESRTQSGNVSFNRSFTYDGYGRLNQRSTSIAGTSFIETTTYDALGRLAAQQDASGYSLMRAYTPSGFLGEQIDTRVGTVYELLSTSARGQPLVDQRGGTATLKSTMAYDPATGRINTVCSGPSCSLQDLKYQFDTAGDLTLRERAVSTQPTVETMTYDGLNRLVQSQLTEINGVNQSTPVTTAALAYDALGNICTKNGASYRYGTGSGCGSASGTAGPHAVTMVGTTAYTYDYDGNQATGNNRTLSYNALNQLTSAVSGSVSTLFLYSPEGERFQRVDSSGTTTWYVGSVEILRSAGVTVEYRRYLSGVAIDHFKPAGGSKTNFTFGDHLGSLDVVATATGAVVETASFDVHGSLRNTTTWNGSAPPPTSTTHGFTGQEEVYNLNLVHLNGRVYDPSLGRMLQSDPMTGPGNQSLNRYSYVVNNPLSLTDPTGYSWWGTLLRDAAAIAITIWAPELAPEAWTAFEADVAAGFIAGVVASGNLQGGLYGAFSAGLFAGVGAAFDANGFASSWATQDVSAGQGVFGTTYNLGGFSAKVLAHGVIGGVMSSLEGGKFGAGFASAGLTEAVSGAINHIDPDNPVGHSLSSERIVVSSLIGGTTSVIAGGKFGNGAVTAAFGRAFNDEKAIQINKEDSAAVARASGGELRHIISLSTDQFIRDFPGTENVVPDDDLQSVSIMRGKFEYDLGEMFASSYSHFMIAQVAEAIGDFPQDMVVGVLTAEIEGGESIQRIYDVFSTLKTASSTTAGTATVTCAVELGGCMFIIKK